MMAEQNKAIQFPKQFPLPRETERGREMERQKKKRRVFEYALRHDYIKKPSSYADIMERLYVRILRSPADGSATIISGGRPERSSKQISTLRILRLVSSVCKRLCWGTTAYLELTFLLLHLKKIVDCCFFP